ncbi:MAG TPA: hypothetical protein VHW60_05880 [Caulobacteraceae bacterium]|jgi:hypothetical protein|nr:hypothetical protein [Caulobacteraceae bacterium]
MKKLFAALAVVIVLGGCVKISKTIPTDLPSYVKIYPGGAQVMTMDLGALKAEVFETPAAQADVATFYRTQATSDGLTETAAPASAANSSGGQQEVTFADNATGRMLAVVTKPQDGKTLVTLTYKPAAAGAAPAPAATNS